MLLRKGYMQSNSLLIEPIRPNECQLVVQSNIYMLYLHTKYKNSRKVKTIFKTVAII